VAGKAGYVPYRDGTTQFYSLNGQELAVSGQVDVKYTMTDSYNTTRGGQGEFYLGDLEGFDMILGMPWLEQWRPTPNFVSKSIRFAKRARYRKVALETSERFMATLLDKDNDGFLLAAGQAGPDNGTLPHWYHGFWAKAFSEEDAAILAEHGPHEMAIDLEEGKDPPHGPLYSLSATEAEMLREYIDKNLARGWIRRSTSKAGAPILFAKKKDGSLRLCVDYRGLNAITIKNRHPLPLIGESLDRLGSASIYTKLDLRDAYHRIRIKEGDEWKTAFRTRYGHFEYTVMPFGLTNAPAVFQNHINSILSDLLDICCIVYLDDILIYSQNEEEHVGQVREVLSRLIQYRLYAKLSKCDFHTQRVGYLGFVVTPQGVEMETDRVDTIRSWPTPASVRDVRIFLGFANYYRRFVEGFSRIAAPLHQITQRPPEASKGGHRQRQEESRPIELDPDAVKAFEILKERFATGPVLVHFDPSLPCRVETDASGFAISGILNQSRPGPNGKDLWHPIAYYSRKMTSAERNYDTHDGELLAVVEAFKHWRHYLEGAAHDITLHTDHHNLQGFMSTKVLSRRQARWAEWLAAFHFTIVHRPGRTNPADGPSRRPDYESGEDAAGSASSDERLLVELQRKLQLTDADSSEERAVTPEGARGPQIGVVVGTTRAVAPGQPMLPTDQTGPPHPVRDAIREGMLGDKHADLAREALSMSEDTRPQWADRWSTGSDDTLLHEGRLYVPGVARVKVLQACHDDPLAGHFGFARTLDLVSREFWWPGVRQMVKDYCQSCMTCARIKPTRHARHGELQSLPIPANIWEDIAMDFITELPPSTLGGREYDSILVVVCRFSKMVHFIPSRGDLDAPGLAETFHREIVRLHGPPKSVVTDRGVLFTSAYWSTFAQCLGTRRLLSTAFHPQTDGQTERMNQVLEQYLRAYMNYEQDNWATLLADAEFAYNNSKHDSTGVAPFELVYGRTIPSAPGSTGLDLTRLSERALQDWKPREEVRETARQNLARAQGYQQKAYNKSHKPKEFKVGDQVMLDTRNIRTTRPKKKLDYKYWGPLKVTERIGKQAYRLDLPKDSGIHPVFHVSLLEDAPNTSLVQRDQDPPHRITPQVGDDVYEVDGILEKRKVGDSWMYLVKWTGYPDSDNQWLPSEEISLSAMRAFEKSQGHSNQRRSRRGRPRKG